MASLYTEKPEKHKAETPHKEHLTWAYMFCNHYKKPDKGSMASSWEEEPAFPVV